MSASSIFNLSRGVAFANVRAESRVLWARLLAYATGTANQELLLRSEYLAAENRMLRGQIRGRLLLSDGEIGAIVRHTRAAS